MVLPSQVFFFASFLLLCIKYMKYTTCGSNILFFVLFCKFQGPIYKNCTKTFAHESFKNLLLPTSIFAARYAMHKRGYCRHAVSVRPSVRPSVTFVDHVKTNKHIFEIFSPSGSHTIIVIPQQTGWRYSDGNPLTGTSNAGGVDKKLDSEQIAGCIGRVYWCL